MIQRHTILINYGYSAQTANNSSSNLTDFGGYQVNNVQGLGGGIVNPSNVRGFLNDDVNEIIINDFFSYLTATTTTIEFAEIYNSDQKLSDVFNDYYNSVILSNQYPTTSTINNSLTGTSGTTIIENGFYNLDGYAYATSMSGIPMSINDSTRFLDVYSALTTYTLEQSYYIPVFITRNNKQAARLKFESCGESVNLLINTGQFTFSGNSNIFSGGYEPVPVDRSAFSFPTQDSPIGSIPEFPVEERIQAVDNEVSISTEPVVTTTEPTVTATEPTNPTRGNITELATPNTPRINLGNFSIRI
jgi:hypothetical protein